MEDLKDSTLNIPNPPKTKTSTEPDSANDTGESSVQQGAEVVNTEDQNVVVNEEAQEEYVSDVNNQSTPTEETTSHSQQLHSFQDDEADDDHEEDDEEEDDDDDELTIGDDPADTKRKVPMM